jgi:hypothetical protein
MLGGHLEDDVVHHRQEGGVIVRGGRVGRHRTGATACSIPSGGQAAQGRIEIIEADAPAMWIFPPPVGQHREPSFQLRVEEKQVDASFAVTDLLQQCPQRISKPSSAADDGGYEHWPYLDEEVLLASRSSKVCMTCHWFRHHAGVNCIPVLTCQLHQGLLAHGEHLTHRCQGWTDDMTRQRGWAPEVA